MCYHIEISPQSMLRLIALAQSFVWKAYAQVYDGGGLSAGTGEASRIIGVSPLSPRATIGAIVNRVLSYTALAAVIVIIIAGIYLIVGMGSDSSKETARKIVVYTIIGLVLILLAKAIVNFVILTVR